MDRSRCGVVGWIGMTAALTMSACSGSGGDLPDVCGEAAAELVARIDADTFSPAAPRVAFGVDRGPSRLVRDDAVGVSLRIPESWTVTHDPYLFETYGFMLRGVDPDPDDAHGPIPVARIALDWRSTPESIDGLVERKRAEYPGVAMARTTITVAGRQAVVLGPVPGGQVSTNVYLADGGRLYRINYYAERLDDVGLELLEALEMHRPTIEVAALGLLDARSPEALHGPLAPLAPIAVEGKRSRAAAIGSAATDEAATDARALAASECEETATTEAAATAEYALGNGCWAQPTDLFIQTTHGWDANGDGWSRMGTPNFWGDNTHGNWGLGRCASSFYTNDLYAIDYYLNTGDRLISPFASGTVTYAGWDPENWWNYGKMVVIRSPSGKFWSLSAHMSFVNVSAGQSVTDDTLIGWAGSTGYADPYPHVHQVFYRWASTSWGRPYGGRGVRQTALRYLGHGGGTYKSFAKGKWTSW